MSGTGDFSAIVGRLMVFGGVAVMGGMLALAQISAPLEPPGKGAQKAPPVAGSNALDPMEERVRRAYSDDQPTASRPDQQTDNRHRGDARAEDRSTKRQGLGIEFDAQAQGGLSIANVQENSLAAQAGLRPHDRIVSADGRAFSNSRQLQAFLSGQFGRRVPIVIERDGRQYTVQLAMSQPAGDVGWLGVYLQGDEDIHGGARITQVYPAGPAARAGLRPDDLVLQVNGRAVAGTPELIAMIEELKPGNRAEFRVLRNNAQLALTAVVGSRDSFIYRGQGDDQSGQRRQVGEDEWFGNIPSYAMELEHNRRMAEQHERIETELRKLQDEVRQLREALQQRK